MVEVSERASPGSGTTARAASSVVRPEPPTPDGRSRRGRGAGRVRALSEARRAWNRGRVDLVADPRCECTRPGCRDRLPAVAETYRRTADQFVVAPSHCEGGDVVRVADRFFVVELRGRELRQSPAETS